MSSSRRESRDVRRLFRRKRKPPAEASRQPDRGSEDAGASAPPHDGVKIGRVTSSFYVARLAPWEMPLHPNRIDDVPSALEVLLIDASAALGASLWAGLGGSAGATVTHALETAIAATLETGSSVVFRWDVGDAAEIEEQLVPLAELASVQLAAPHSPRTADLEVLPHGVAGELFTATGSHEHGLGMLAAGTLDGWADPVPAAENVPSHAATIGAATLGDPQRSAAWLATIRTLALPHPITPLTYHLASEAVAAGVALDDGVEAETTTHHQVLDVLIRIAGDPS